MAESGTEQPANLSTPTNPPTQPFAHRPARPPTHQLTINLPTGPPALLSKHQVAIADSLSAALTADREASALAGRKLQLGQVVMACENIYLRCCDRSTVQRKTRQLPADADEEAVLGDMLEKLDFIQVRARPTGREDTVQGCVVYAVRTIEHDRA